MTGGPQVTVREEEGDRRVAVIPVVPGFVTEVVGSQEGRMVIRWLAVFPDRVELHYREDAPRLYTSSWKVAG